METSRGQNPNFTGIGGVLRMVFLARRCGGGLSWPAGFRVGLFENSGRTLRVLSKTPWGLTRGDFGEDFIQNPHSLAVEAPP